MNRLSIVSMFALICATPALAQDQEALMQELQDVKQELSIIKQMLSDVLAQDDTVDTPPTPPETDVPVTETQTDPVVDQYQPGFIVNVYSEPSDHLSRDTEVGQFLGQNFPISGQEHLENGVLYRNKSAYEIQGFLKAETEGSYQVALDINGRFMRCGYEIHLNGQRLVSNVEYVEKPLTDAATVNLQPGLYPLSVWISCSPYSGENDAEYSVLIRTPTDRNLQPGPRDILLVRKN